MSEHDDVPTLTDGVVVLRTDTERGAGTWAFDVHAPDGDDVLRHAGTVALTDRGHGRAEVAVAAAAWVSGTGYLVRALELLLDWGFTEQGLATVLCWVETGEWATRRVAWRLGFSFDGTVRRWLPHDGGLRDAWVGSLAADAVRRPRAPWLEAPTIVGRQVVLREYDDTDAPRVVEACSDERTSYWLSGLPSPYTLDDARTYIEGRREQHATAAGVTWAVADHDDGTLLGTISLFDLELGESAEIGYWTHPAARGRGLMREACGLVVRHAFVPSDDGGLGLHRLRVMVAEGNDASCHVVEANGFVHTGRIRREHRMRDGSYLDMRCYDLLASEYPRGVSA